MPAPAKILIICLKHLGDVVTTTPLIPILKGSFPGCVIHYAVYREALPLVSSHPDVSRTFGALRRTGALPFWRITGEFRRERYDYVLDLSEGRRGAKHCLFSGGAIRLGYRSKTFKFWRRLAPTIFIPSREDEAVRPVSDCHADFARAIGCRFDSLPLPKIHPSPRAADKAADYLASLGIKGGPIAVAHFTATDDIRLWPPRHAAKAASFLARKLGPVLLVSGDKAKETAFVGRVLAESNGRVVATGPLDLDLLMGILQRAGICIALDSLVGHMAGALGCPVLSIFGPSRERHWAPRGPMIEVVHTDRACRSCVTGGCLGDSLSACLDELDFDSWVKPRLEAMLGRIAKAGGSPAGDGQGGKSPLGEIPAEKPRGEEGPPGKGRDEGSPAGKTGNGGGPS
jgi:ADP-heptose:LPS heptosyltransferase